MATQIAPTPTVRGKEALKILEEANREPSQDVEIGRKILAEMFKPLITSDEITNS